MSELQTEDMQQGIEPELQEDNQEHDTGTGQEPGADLAPVSESQHEENDSGFNQEAVNKVINKKHAEKMEALRQVEEERQRVEQLQAQLAKYQQTQEPQIPEMPDPFDDDFNVKLEQREQAIMRKAQYDIEQRQKQESQQQQQLQQQQQQMDNLQKSINSYNDRAKASGINEAKLEAAGNTVMAYGISDSHALSILHDPDGPLITTYLAENPAQIAEMSSMNDYQLAMHIERNVRPNALKLKQKTPSAPDPAQRISGNGVDKESGKYPNLGKAKFE
jgi:multidrug efflux pump subunit AcrA (membrane-fusion protein)